MLKSLQSRHRLAVALCVLLSSFSAKLWSQAAPTAERNIELQAGGGFTGSNPDYSPNKFYGFGLWGDADFVKHIGAEIEYHRISGNGNFSISESSFSVDVRGHFSYGPLKPYLKLGVGIGSFSGGKFVLPAQNDSFKMYLAGVGVDYRVTPRWSARADYEYQRWGSFPGNGSAADPGKGLQPNLLTIGVARHF